MCVSQAFLRRWRNWQSGERKGRSARLCAAAAACGRGAPPWAARRRDAGPPKAPAAGPTVKSACHQRALARAAAVGGVQGARAAGRRAGAPAAKTLAGRARRCGLHGSTTAQITPTTVRPVAAEPPESRRTSSCALACPATAPCPTRGSRTCAVPRRGANVVVVAAATRTAAARELLLLVPLPRRQPRRRRRGSALRQLAVVVVRVRVGGRR